MIQSRQSSLQEINEIILKAAIHTMSIPSSTQEKIDTVPHDYGKAPYFTYQISLDGLVYLPMPNGEMGSDNNKDVFMYTDENNVYFHYFYSLSSGLPSAFSYYIRYKLYLTEAVK